MKICQHRSHNEIDKLKLGMRTVSQRMKKGIHTGDRSNLGIFTERSRLIVDRQYFSSILRAQIVMI